MADTFNFHETFQPELTYVARIVELASTEYRGDKFQISEFTGIPTGEKKGKVEPHIKYANYMGLVDYEINRGIYCLKLTDLGAEVFRQDKYLHEELTLWLLHYGITKNKNGAPQWSYLVHRVHDGFNTDISTNHISAMLQKDFYVNSSDASKAISVVKNCYTNGAFSSLQYLEWNEKLRFFEHSENSQFQYLYAYALLDCWDLFFAEKKEITISEISNTLGLGKVFGFNDEELDSVLSTMTDGRILSMNRQLFPITVIRTEQTQEVLARLYSMLM